MLSGVVGGVRSRVSKLVLSGEVLRPGDRRDSDVSAMTATALYGEWIEALVKRSGESCVVVFV